MNRADSPSWTAAKAAGDRAEEAIAAWLRGRGWETWLAPGDAALPADVLIQARAEVKRDLAAVNSGNVCVETSCRGRPSGLSTTAADFWFIIVGSEVFWVRPDTLREMLATGGFREVAAGDGKHARCRLVPVSVLRECPHVRIFKLPSGQHGGEA